MVRAVRGATTVENNSTDEIICNTKELLEKMFSENSVEHNDLISIIFTATDDIDACFPAKAARELGYTDVPLMCMREINVKNSLKKCIRVMINYNSDKTLSQIKHIYLNDAKVLRTDLN